MKKQGPPPCGRNMVGSFMDYISDGPSFRTSALSLPIRKHMVYEADMTKFTVNDRPVQYRMDPDTPLLWALRDASNLTGTKYGCGTGDCGACTVEIDGEAVRSCQISIATVEGRFVTTIEALSSDRSHQVPQDRKRTRLNPSQSCAPRMTFSA